METESSLHFYLNLKLNFKLNLELNFNMNIKQKRQTIQKTIAMIYKGLV